MATITFNESRPADVEGGCEKRQRIHSVLICIVDKWLVISFAHNIEKVQKIISQFLRNIVYATVC